MRGGNISFNNEFVVYLNFADQLLEWSVDVKVCCPIMTKAFPYPKLRADLISLKKPNFSGLKVIHNADPD